MFLLLFFNIMPFFAALLILRWVQGGTRESNACNNLKLPAGATGFALRVVCILRAVVPRRVTAVGGT